MKNILFDIAFVAIVAFFAGCHTNCPPDKKIGDIDIDTESMTFIPYVGAEKLIFKNEAGEEIVFTSSGYRDEKNRVAVHKICTEVKYDGKSTYEYYEGRNKSIVFFADDKYALNIGIFTTILRPEEELFLDKMKVDLNAEGSIGSFDLVTKIRFSEPYETSELNLTNPAIKIDSIMLGNTTYHDVFTSEAEEFGQIFYTKENGLVGFNHWSEHYYLDRIE